MIGDGSRLPVSIDRVVSLGMARARRALGNLDPQRRRDRHGDGIQYGGGGTRHDTALAVSSVGARLPRATYAALPYKTTLFLGYDNRLNRPLARRLNLDAECGMPKSVDTARKSGNIKDYYHIQEVAAGSVFYGSFLHADPLSIAHEAYGRATSSASSSGSGSAATASASSNAVADTPRHLSQPAYGAAVRSGCRPCTRGRTVCTTSNPASHLNRTWLCGSTAGWS